MKRPRRYIEGIKRAAVEAGEPDFMPSKTFAFVKMEASELKNRNRPMMPPRVIVEHVLAEPFRPFRIHTASGRTFEIRHPEFVQMGRSILTVYTPPENDPNGPQQWEKVPLMLIESIAPLDAASVNPGVQ